MTARSLVALARFAHPDAYERVRSTFRFYSKDIEPDAQAARIVLEAHGAGLRRAAVYGASAARRRSVTTGRKGGNTK